MNAQEFKTALRGGPYAWPGGYPCYFVTDDGAALSYQAARDNIRLILGELRHRGSNPGWGVSWFGINWEDPDLCCDHTGEPIPSAYAGDER